MYGQADFTKKLEPIEGCPHSSILSEQDHGNLSKFILAA